MPKWIAYFSFQGRMGMDTKFETTFLVQDRGSRRWDDERIFRFPYPYPYKPLPCAESMAGTTYLGNAPPASGSRSEWSVEWSQAIHGRSLGTKRRRNSITSPSTDWVSLLRTRAGGRSAHSACPHGPPVTHLRNGAHGHISRASPRQIYTPFLHSRDGHVDGPTREPRGLQRDWGHESEGKNLSAEAVSKRPRLHLEEIPVGDGRHNVRQRQGNARSALHHIVPKHRATRQDWLIGRCQKREYFRRDSELGHRIQTI